MSLSLYFCEILSLCSLCLCLSLSLSVSVSVSVSVCPFFCFFFFVFSLSLSLSLSLSIPLSVFHSLPLSPCTRSWTNQGSGSDKSRVEKAVCPGDGPGNVAQVAPCSESAQPWFTWACGEECGEVTSTKIGLFVSFPREVMKIRPQTPRFSKSALP